MNADITYCALRLAWTPANLIAWEKVSFSTFSRAEEKKNNKTGANANSRRYTWTWVREMRACERWRICEWKLTSCY